MKRTFAVLSSGIFILILIIYFQNCDQKAFIRNQTNSHETAALPSTSTSSEDEGDSFVMNGDLRMTAAGSALSLSISGEAVLVRDKKRGTQISLQAFGLPTSTMIMAHVHDLPCSLGGGGHYKIDPTITATQEENEIWLHLTTDSTGGVLTSVNTNHYARPEAQSLVIHAADNSRIACVDFSASKKTLIKGGVWDLLNAGKNLGLKLLGNAVLTRDGSGRSLVRWSVGGLTPSTNYMAHVHAQPCAMDEGGTHYKLNANVTEATASTNNEMWLTINTDADGLSVGQLNVFNHVARADALSLVIHNPLDMTMRLACLDLNKDAGFVALSLGLKNSVVVNGTASINRLTNYTTHFELTISGLAMNATYMAHVHNQPCSISDGGGHYKIDTSITATEEKNEVWFHLTSDANGAATESMDINHLARADASSIVIHDPTTNGRLACADLF